MKALELDGIPKRVYTVVKDENRAMNQILEGWMESADV
jgi:hypothetical protein